MDIKIKECLVWRIAKSIRRELIKPRAVSRSLPDLVRDDMLLGLVDEFPTLAQRSWAFEMPDVAARLTAHRFVRDQWDAVTEFPRGLEDLIVPNHIWVFWAQGFSAAPPVVQLCRKRLDAMKGKCEVRELCAETVTRWCTIPEDVKQSLAGNWTTYSDVVRTALLAEHGGIWLDATAFLAQPVDLLLPPRLQEVFPYTRSDQLPCSWCMVSPIGHPIVRMLRDVQIRWWTMHSELPAYFWIHYLFEAMLAQHGACRRWWATANPTSGWLANVLVRRLNMPYDELRIRQILGLTAVQKLTFKGSAVESPKRGGMLETLLNNPNC